MSLYAFASLFWQQMLFWGFGNERAALGMERMVDLSKFCEPGTKSIHLTARRKWEGATIRSFCVGGGEVLIVDSLFWEKN
jgi:hypothetical protein